MPHYVQRDFQTINFIYVYFYISNSKLPSLTLVNNLLMTNTEPLQKLYVLVARSTNLWIRVHLCIGYDQRNCLFAYLHHWRLEVILLQNIETSALCCQYLLNFDHLSNNTVIQKCINRCNMEPSCSKHFIGSTKTCNTIIFLLKVARCWFDILDISTYYKQKHICTPLRNSWRPYDVMFVCLLPAKYNIRANEFTFTNIK